MFLFRFGILLATLLLSACSLPIFEQFKTSDSKDVEPSQIEEIRIELEKDTSNLVEVTQDEATNSVSENTLENAQNQYKVQRKLAETNYAELSYRTGKADALPRLSTINIDDTKDLDSATQALRNYTSKTDTQIALLNSRVINRQQSAAKGDLVRIFLSDTTVIHNDSIFKPQSLVGQWVRGESRVIRLKDNFLFDDPRSEDLKITFSESYQLLVNGKVVATVNPNREKSSAKFEVLTQNASGTIVGKLDYRIEQ